MKGEFKYFSYSFLLYRRGNYVHHHWGCLSIYRPLSNPFRFLGIWFFFCRHELLQTIKMILFISHSAKLNLKKECGSHYLPILDLTPRCTYRTMTDKLMYIPNDDTQKYFFCKLCLVIEKCPQIYKANE